MSHQHRIGEEFEDQFEVQIEDGSEDRDQRSSMILRCEVLDSLGRTFPCFLRNISRQGVSARGCTGLRVGQQLTVVLPVIGAINGVVRWADHDKFGLELEAEVVPEMLKFAGAPIAAAQPKFNLLPQHRPITDCRRPPLRAAS